jgi:hypothetical protein
MANYGLYKNINPSSITSAVSSLKSQLSPTKQQLADIKSGLSDGVWKVNAKNTLFTALDKINSEVYKEIYDNLDNLSTIANLISEYKTAETNANTYKEYLASATNKTPQSTIDGWRRSLASYEQTMDSKEASIKSKL